MLCECKESDGNYTCPRCARDYCSLNCYKRFHELCFQAAKKELDQEALRNHKIKNPQPFKKQLKEIHRKLEKADEQFAGEPDPIFTEERLMALADKISQKGSLDFEDFTPQELQYFNPTEIMPQWRPWWESDTADEIPKHPMSSTHVCCAESTTFSTAMVYDLMYAITVYCCISRFVIGDWECLGEPLLETLMSSSCVFDVPRTFQFTSPLEWTWEWLGEVHADDRANRRGYRTSKFWISLYESSAGTGDDIARDDVVVEDGPQLLEVPPSQDGSRGSDLDLLKRALEDMVVVCGDLGKCRTVFCHLQKLLKKEYKSLGGGTGGEPSKRYRGLMQRLRLWQSIVDNHQPSIQGNINAGLRSIFCGNTF
ncbi:HIT zinc finger protein [Gregarina niphandrodes]|uniref:HIT zinc finger protein n=1 Tax=Gregarina niphandrodes TaxID=110365 RepID=A0A023BD08_GRENI|nr:HIT zinc finger protein [Gregarina niphandrodes]EZG85644.1 HIT zinc finger protein [Gregarina niphandrodes]|eukprot:XP_011128823.1 HIT zinc finger protein [Gregarina niphandrodes]